MHRRLHKIVALFRVDAIGVSMPGPRLHGRICRIVGMVSPARISQTRIFCLAALIALVCVSFVASGLTRAQESSGDDWEKAAGGKMAFEAASVKRDTRDWSSVEPDINIPLDDSDTYVPTGGLYIGTNIELWSYVVFSYKLNTNQLPILKAEAPKWVDTEHFDIQARAAGNPTKDQYRLMMQSLLADRFKLAAHFESRQMPVYALVLAKPGVTGPQLRPFPDGTPCANEPPAIAGQSSFSTPQPLASGFPDRCGGLGQSSAFWALPDFSAAVHHVGARDMTMDLIARNVAHMANLDRPLLDKTGLTGTFDASIEYAPAPQPGADTQAQSSEPTFQQALADQLGLKIESTTGSVRVLVIDHIEEPTPN
jgi:uncharacterized protein (TIGR03435 family)